MLKVFKYPVPMGDIVTIEMPWASEMLDVQFQGNELYLWALVDPTDEMVQRRFRIAGTGHPIEFKWSQLKHVGTFQMQGGAVIFHVFEIIDFPMRAR